MSLIRPFFDCDRFGCPPAGDVCCRPRRGAGCHEVYDLGGLSAAISAAMRAASSVPGSRAGAAGAVAASSAPSCACKAAICARRASVSSTTARGGCLRPRPAAASDFNRLFRLFGSDDIGRNCCGSGRFHLQLAGVSTTGAATSTSAVSSDGSAAATRPRRCHRGRFDLRPPARQPRPHHRAVRRRRHRLPRPLQLQALRLQPPARQPPAQ